MQGFSTMKRDSLISLLFKGQGHKKDTSEQLSRQDACLATHIAQVREPAPGGGTVSQKKLLVLSTQERKESNSPQCYPEPKDETSDKPKQVHTDTAGETQQGTGRQRQLARLASAQSWPPQTGRGRGVAPTCGVHGTAAPCEQAVLKGIGAVHGTSWSELPRRPDSTVCSAAITLSCQRLRSPHAQPGLSDDLAEPFLPHQHERPKPIKMEKQKAGIELRCCGPGRDIEHGAGLASARSWVRPLAPHRDR